MNIDIQPEDQAIFDRLKSTGRMTAGLRRKITQQHNWCSCCDKMIFPYRPAFAGYDADDKPVLACAKCAVTRVTELATPVYPKMNLDISLPDETVLWRYMDFSKFVAMLMQRGLYLPRASNMEDKFEGAAGLARREHVWDEHYLKRYREVVSGPGPDGRPINISPEDIECEARRLLRSTKAATVASRSRPISCWHANAGESEAQWRLYCPPQTMGIAVKSSVDRLWNAMSGEQNAVVGRVHYLDFNTAFAVTGRERIFCKRASLAHEREVRAVILEDDGHEDTPGRLVGCDLAALIDVVVLSPFAPEWFQWVLSDVISKFGWSIPVVKSDLLDPPFY
ncbi:hypothetical protein [Brevundimonas sp.]|uniref:hypothetical protein n=1 Tax=Brevundimonas sp. TaxID=1871086 RepID=UPI003A93C6A0